MLVEFMASISQDIKIRCLANTPSSSFGALSELEGLGSPKSRSGSRRSRPKTSKSKSGRQTMARRPGGEKSHSRKSQDTG